MERRDTGDVMTKTELLNRAARSEEERILLSKVLDKLDLAHNREIPAHTGFLSPQERACVEGLLHAVGRPRHVFWGGFEGAERTLCALLPDWQGADGWQDGAGPVCALRVSYPEDAPLTHRDFLGAILGLGIRREKVGDLLVRRGICDVLLLNEVEEFLLLHLERAGRTRLTLTPLPLSRLSPKEPELRRVSDTVAALRLDAVVAASFSLSRSKAVDLIASGKLQLNHRVCDKPDKSVAEGDVLSCRGLGKCVVRATERRSKKGRIILEFEQYIG